MYSPRRKWGVAALVGGLMTVFMAAGCGEENNDPNPLNIKLTDSGFTIPDSVEGPLVTVSFTNDTKKTADAQLVRVDSGHTTEEALKVIGAGENTPIPDWVHGEGGLGDTEGGESYDATMQLDEGSYVVVNDDAQGKPPTADFTVSGGNEGDLADTDATVTGAKVGEDEYAWEVDGLKAGSNTVTFNSEGGEEALHHIVAIPLKEGATIEDAKKFLDTEQGPPPFTSEPVASTAVLDGDKSLTTTLELKPGHYAFACFLPDKNEKPPKPHFKEGMLKEVDIG